MNNKIKILTAILIMSFVFSDDNSLKIISYNVHGFGTKKISKKIKNIIKKIKDFDIFLIQENWAYEKVFKENFSFHNFIFRNKKRNTFLGSGLTTAFNEKIKIIDAKSIDFDECSGFLFKGADCLATKGFVFSRINYKNHIIDFYNTHLDAGNSYSDSYVRQKQIQKLKKYIYRQSEGYPVIISGDFNINYATNNEVIDSFLIDLNLNKYKDSLGAAIDYIFYRDSDKLKIDVFDISHLYKFIELSDHNPISIEIKITK